MKRKSGLNIGLLSKRNGSLIYSGEGTLQIYAYVAIKHTLNRDPTTAMAFEKLEYDLCDMIEDLFNMDLAVSRCKVYLAHEL